MLITAMCDACGLMFGATNIIGGSGSVKFENSFVNCPRCQSDARIIDGVHQTLGNSVRILATTKRSAESLLALSNALTEARERNASHEEIKSTIEAHVPELKTLSDWLPRKRSELYPFIMVFVALLALIINSMKDKQSMTPKQVEDMVDAAVTKAVAAQTASSPKPTPTAMNRAQRRASRSPRARHK
ncbi:MAG: hypothetical protein ABR568_05665 [Pyrinomonadaceae bacterium]